MKHALLFAAFLLTPALALAQESAFSTGPVITEFGPTATVQTDFKIPKTRNSKSCSTRQRRLVHFANANCTTRRDE